MALVAMAGSAFMTIGLGEILTGGQVWIISRDVWLTTNSAQYVANGGGGAVYSVNPYFAALPGFLYLYAPVAALGDALGLVPAYPLLLGHPSMWLLTGPFFSVCSATAVLGVDYLSDTLGVSSFRRRLISAGTAVLVVAPAAGYEGHPEDMLALALVCLSLALFLRGRLSGSALVLAVAVLMQTWAGLLIPVLVAASPAGQRLRTLVRAALAPSVLGLVLLIGDFPDASVDLLKQPMPDTGQHLPWWQLASHLTVVSLGSKIHMVTGSTTRSLAVVVAVAAAIWLWRHPGQDRMVLCAALALYARTFFETEYWPYYVAPAAVMLLVLGSRTTAGNPRRFAVLAVSSFLLYANSAPVFDHIRFPSYLALAIVTATGALCVGAIDPQALDEDETPQPVIGSGSAQLPVPVG